MKSLLHDPLNALVAEEGNGRGRGRGARCALHVDRTRSLRVLRVSAVQRRAERENAPAGSKPSTESASDDHHPPRLVGGFVSGLTGVAGIVHGVLVDLVVRRHLDRKLLV